MRSGQRGKAFVLATTSVQLQIKRRGGGGGGGGSRIYNTGCRALLVKLGWREENTSVREKNVYSKYISI